MQPSVLTFAVIAFYMREGTIAGRYPRLNLLRLAPLRWIAHPAIVALVRLLAVMVFVLTLYAGFVGVQNPYSNLITTMIWVVWWVGCAFVCALIVDLWMLVNPLDTIFAWCEALYAALTGGRSLSRRLPYPSWLGAWPAVALFLCFAWAELIWQDNDVPAYLARAIVVYTLVTWSGMFLYGRQVWLQNGEAFTILFGILGRFAPLAATPPFIPGAARALYMRPPGAGLLAGDRVRPSLLVFVLLMLATVTFDGFLETPLNQRLHTAVQSSPALTSLLFELSERGLGETQVINTVTLVAFALGFIAAYWLASWAMLGMARKWSPAPFSVSEAACAFVLTLVPIAVAYHLSHYFSLLLTAGQLIIPLASNPFGFGWDLFGTAQYQVDLGIVSPYVFWYGAVTLIVVGHVIAVFLAHAAALRMFGSRRAALASQIPIVVLMVAYTTLSLWILAQPIVG